MPPKRAHVCLSPLVGGTRDRHDDGPGSVVECGNDFVDRLLDLAEVAVIVDLPGVSSRSAGIRTAHGHDGRYRRLTWTRDGRDEPRR